MSLDSLRSVSLRALLLANQADGCSAGLSEWIAVIGCYTPLLFSICFFTIFNMLFKVFQALNYVFQYVLNYSFQHALQ
jgi:hypothetical protein